MVTIINNNSKEHSTERSAWTCSTQVYEFFSVFLDRNILDTKSFNLSFIPIEYINQVFLSTKTEESLGYLNLLMILFSEQYQKEITGNHKLHLPEAKYTLMRSQFLLFCQCEILRRSNKIDTLSEKNLFNPNLKTQFFITASHSIQTIIIKSKQFNIDLIYKKIN